MEYLNIFFHSFAYWMLNYTICILLFVISCIYLTDSLKIRFRHHSFCWSHQPTLFHLFLNYGIPSENLHYHYKSPPIRTNFLIMSFIILHGIVVPSLIQAVCLVRFSHMNSHKAILLLMVTRFWITDTNHYSLLLFQSLYKVLFHLYPNFLKGCSIGVPSKSTTRWRCLTSFYLDV